MLLVIFCKVFLFIWIVTEQKSSSITVFLLFLTLFTENFFSPLFQEADEEDSDGEGGDEGDEEVLPSNISFNDCT